MRLPAALKASIRASGSSVSSDFDINGDVEKKRVRGTINGGGPLFDMSTSNGRIRLERL